MELNAEAKRIMALSLGKLYSSRMHRGGMKLHRSLQLSLVMRSARDIYFTAKLESDAAGRQPGAPGEDEEVAMVTEAVPAQPAGPAAADPQQSETGTEAHTETELSPEPSCAPAVTQPLTEAPSNVPARTECKPKPAQIVTPADKENASPGSGCAVPALASDRHTRKRRGNSAAEPEFLPSKKARMEQRKGGESGLHSGSCRGGASLASALFRTIVAF
ncbi:hypothetical protein AOXY_G29379 [Acipenser oxyrinchus oxyrinchus]|uniref:Immediate early response 2 n=1 Tax=Acipenser oxyrinchus oxyrinchus TaxID=40147 RepID=A0AAD8FQQ2_ACIOX|nr:hypothetical protein AOXY_G29379 [Acipenser oxyrinchus oxyrinchus]